MLCMQLAHGYIREVMDEEEYLDYPYLPGELFCGLRGGIGRHSGLRNRALIGVGVRVPPGPPFLLTAQRRTSGEGGIWKPVY